MPHKGVLNFTLSFVLVELLGGFYARDYGILTPDIMQTTRTIDRLLWPAWEATAACGAAWLLMFLFVFPIEWLRSNLSGPHLIIDGMLLIVVTISYRGGAAALYRRVVRRLQRA